MIGEILGHYKILEKLGEGGMGVVYLAEDTRLDRRVALKVLPADLAESPERLDRFQREAKVLAALDHPNIITIHSVEEEGGVRFLTMQFVDGKPLSEIIPPDGLPLESFFKLAIPVADALATAHARGIIHRDLKPGNIMVHDDGRVMVLDFGLAKLWQEVSVPEASTMPTEALTQEGKVVGTIPYMSPEQLEGKELDARTDLFSMGVVFYEMATGNRPFHGETSVSLMSSIVKDTPAPLDTRRPGLPHHLGRIIQRCLEKDPADRYQTMRDVVLELRNLRREIDSATGESVTARLDRTEATGVRDRRWQWSVAALALLVVVVLAVWRLGGREEVTTGADGSDESGSVTEIEEPRARVLYEQAQQYSRDAESVAQWELAETTMRQAIEIEPENPWLQAELAHLLVDRQEAHPEVERKQEAARLAAAALAADPALASAWVVKGRLARMEGDYAAALDAARQAQSLDPQDPASGYLLGLTLIRQGSKEEGLAEVRRAAELDPDPINVHFKLGFTLQHLGRLDEAIQEYKRVTEYAPGHGSALNNLAVCYFWMGRYREAVPVFRKLLEIRPEDKSAATNLGTVYYYLDRMEEAVEAYQLANRLSPGEPMIENNLGDAFSKLGRPDEARQWYLKAIDSAEESLARGGSRTALLELKYLALAKVGRLEEATAGTEQLATDYPGDFSVLYTAAQIHALAGQREPLLDYTERAIRAGCPREEFARAPEFAAFQDDAAFQELLAADLDTP